MPTDPELGSIFKRISIPEAEHLAELGILLNDLDASIACLALYFDKYSGTEVRGEDLIVSGSLFRNGIILFCSCFSRSPSEKVKPTPEEVYNPLLGDQWHDYFQALHDMRDSFVAHNFGSLRQHDVDVQCREEDGKLVASRIMGAYANFGGWNANEKPKLLSFIEMARQHILAQQGKYDKIVWEKVSKLTPAQLAELPDLKLNIPDPTDWKTPREKFRRKRKGRRTLAVEHQFRRTPVPD